VATQLQTNTSFFSEGLLLLKGLSQGNRLGLHSYGAIDRECWRAPQESPTRCLSKEVTLSGSFIHSFLPPLAQKPPIMIHNEITLTGVVGILIIHIIYSLK